MTGQVNRRWLVAAPPEGSVGPGNFRWTESAMPKIRPGTAVVRNLWFSFDPTQVLAMGSSAAEGGVPVGEVMRTLAVSQIVESQIPQFRPGELVQGHAGWEDYSLIDGHGFFETTKVPRDGSLLRSR